MTPRFRQSLAALVALAALALVPATGWAGDFKSQSTFGSSFFSASPPCPVNQFPTLESIVPMPQILDPFEEDLIPMFCQVQVAKGEKPVKKVKGTFFADLIVLDNETGELERFPVKSGRFKTNRDGISEFDFDLPAEIFADGFESGDVSAWSYTRTSFSNKKKGDRAAVSCGKGVSRSD